MSKLILLKNDSVEIWKEDGILFGHYLCEVLDLEQAKEIVNSRREVASDKNYRSVVDVRGVKRVSKEARDFFASDYAYEYLESFAMVVESKLTQLQANFYLKFRPAKIPQRIFTTVEEAIKWSKNLEIRKG